MDDQDFLWVDQQHEEPNYDDIIENDAEIDNLSDLIEEQGVEGYEEVNILDDNSNEDDAYYIDEEIMHEKYDHPESNLIYLTDDGIISKSAQIGVGISHLIEQRVEEAENKIIGDQDAQEEYIAEVITEEDWIQSQGEDIVPVSMEQVVTSENYPQEEEDIVPLQTDQDEYTTQRPYPCDFCSRRFRKKANLQNHMIAHQNVRPHMCNLCGSRYVRKCDLINHLKIHAYNIEDEQLAGPSSSGGKKKPSSSKNFDDLSFLNDSYDTLHEEDDFDYNHYSKPIKPMPSTKASSTKISTKGTSKKVIAKKSKTPTISKKQFERISKDKSLTDLNITIDKSTANKTIPKSDTTEYVERFPILDARKPFVCQRCGVAFTRQKALESHMKHVHQGEQEQSFDCEICGDSFFDSTSLEEHLELRHNYSTRIRKTGGKTTSGKVPSRSQIMDFEDSNSEYEPDKNTDEIDDDDDYEEDAGHICDKCDMTFKNADSLKRHIKTHFIKSEALSDYDDSSGEGSGKGKSKIAGDANLGCNVCGESFTEALDLLAHAEIHARFQPFKCLLCGETFFEENKIKMHLMDNHRNEMTESSCKLCGKQCRDQRSLIKHSWEHSREKNYSCSLCGKTFHNKARLKRHIASHRNKSVVCEICNEEFPDGRQLMNHRHSHTKSNQFPCTECGKSFGSRSSQQIHIRIHTGERPYQCRFCWKAFADGGTLRKHERIHTGEKPYCCLVCPRAFNQRVVLREHIRSHHSAPDPQHGTTLTPYYCSLCGDLFSSSLELIHHLIEHSDKSTAAKRVQPTGPRKYKRRRKLNDEDASSVTTDSKYQRIKQEPVEKEKIINKKGLLTSTVALYKPPNEVEEFTLPEEIFAVAREKKIEDKKVTNNRGTASRPKMIFTEKTRVPVFDGRRKTRTMIQKQVLNRNQIQTSRHLAMHNKGKKQPTQEEEDDDEDNDSNGSETCSNEDDPNEDVLHTLLKRERKLSEKFTIDLVNDLQDILRSPIKTSITIDEEEEPLIDSPNSRRNRRQTFSRYDTNSTNINGMNYKRGIEENGQQSEVEEVERIIIKEEEILIDTHSCEICGDDFESREELLAHVPIHI
ncbi:hypothetical protein PVAND_006337 [Polypedilum vanderplanki]|uniref:Zinc finger protein 865 n=1 Tax=Polypedilum vanderplanki TaxID=319348 RepID=A0A9J6C3B9_POLVA|nr:hypothetical protein PVAND_006337 [Polypedilum vanderplanki]